MRITFLGTGGGRVTVVNQIRASGGFILEMDDQMFHIDPGPGALIRAKQYNVPLRKVTGVFVSHGHPDHCADAELVVEAMTDLVNKKKGVIVGSPEVMKGGENHRASFSPYHLNAAKRNETLRTGKSIQVGRIRVTGTKTDHGKGAKEGVGFVFDGEEKVGYTSDTDYFDGIDEFFQGCDTLIINCLRPRKETWPTHMNTEKAAELVSKAKPKVAVITHFGIKMLRAGPEKEAAWIEKQTGVRTIAARDGMVLEMDNGKVEIRRSGKIDEKASLKGFFEK